MDSSETASAGEPLLRDDPRRLLGLLWVAPEAGFVPLGPGLLTIGRSAEASVRLPDEQVSRLHARLSKSGPLHVLADAGSRNGSWVNGERIDCAPLSLGDVVRFGAFVGVVTALDADLATSGRLFDHAAGAVIGPRTRALWRRLEGIARTGLPVVIEGETGTGKEVFARAIHDRAGGGPFIGVNCAALPEHLVEAQLFGWSRGSYTGAVGASRGLFEAADGGTLLLDEVVSLPLSQQAKLLRVLEECAVTRLGETAPRPVRVRILAAAQRPLLSLVKAGAFRGDLLARLAGETLRLPPLRERREEIVGLFMHHFRTVGGKPSALGASFLEALCLHSWPMNVRELIQVARQAQLQSLEPGKLMGSNLSQLLERAQGVTSGEVVAEAHSSPGPAGTCTAADVRAPRRASWLRQHESELNALLDALTRVGGNISEAARRLGISRQKAGRLLAARKELEVVGKLSSERRRH